MKQEIRLFEHCAAEWGPDDRENIKLEDAGKSYKAKNLLVKFKHMAFRVDSILNTEVEKKQCDFLLLRGNKDNFKGASFLIECKDSAQEKELKDSVKQLEQTYEKLKSEYPNWCMHYPQVSLRISASATKRKLIDSYFINIKKIAKRHGGSFDIHRFDVAPEVFDGVQEFKQRQ